MMRLLLPASIRLQEHLEPMTVLWVKADRGQLRQLLLQLTVHARESMPDGGVLGISAGLATSGELARTGGELREGASFVSLKLSDTGAGLPPAAQARTPRSGCLTDLRGLAAAPDLDAGVLPSMAKSCGGYLDVRCVIGRGTTFTLLLPCVRPHAVMESAAPSSPFIAG